MTDLKYLDGFGNHFSTEAKPGALPSGQNNPQKAPLGLYAEQLSGTAFTAPRRENQRTWLYRIRPSVLHSDFETIKWNTWRTPPLSNLTPPTQMRWDPLPEPTEPTGFFESFHTMVLNGNVLSRSGCAAHLYAANHNDPNRYFYNSDGDLLIVPQEGELRLNTEMGILDVRPGEIAVIQRGIKFQVELKEKKARGYVCENYGAPFQLPDLGPIGANGLANPRDFQTPVACFENREGDFELITKFQGNFFSAQMSHSPLDVVGWHGNYAPYKYDLKLFNTMNTVSFDHPDPSIFTVLTSPTDRAGTANIDFVIFPPRWMVAEHTFRPPYYHRNVMSEFMGLIHGVYDAKEKGFVPGGSSLHNCMSAHGPEADVFEKASNVDLKPERYENTLAFMFESALPFQVPETALNVPWRQKDYLKCWDGLNANFKQK